MQRKILLTISKAVLILTVLNVLSWSVFHANTGGKKLGFATKYIKEFSRFPKTAINVLKGLSTSEILVNVDPSFNYLNDIDYDLFALNSSFIDQKWIISLTNLRNDSLIQEWFVEKNEFMQSDRIFSHADIRMPILLKDKSLIVHNDETSNLYRINENSEILWHNTQHQFHHSINQDYAGNIWTCTRELIQNQEQNLEYWDNFLTRVDVESGKTLSHISLAQVFMENGLSYLIHGYNNSVARSGNDPMHLNEIEPVFEDSKYWKKGDLFISLRHRSLIFLYRPSTNKIIRTIYGPFYNQHDIDIISDSTISIFNNNVSSLQRIDELSENSSQSNFYSDLSLNTTAEVLVYQMKDSTFTSLYPKRFIENKIFTETQGLHHLLSNGDLFIDQYDEGKVFIFNEDRTLLKKYFNKPINGQTERTHWVRVYENLNFLN